jgi:hypothetical protein
MFDIPKELTINGINRKIRKDGDFRMVLDCFAALEDNELGKQERILTCLIIFYDGVNSVDDLAEMFGSELQEPVTEMFKFFNCGQVSVGAHTSHKLIDWKQDAPLIASAINNIAGKEIRAESYLHWWTFMGYYLAIGDCPLATVVGIRNKIKTGKKLEKHEREFKKENPHYFIWDSQSVEQKEAEELIREMWNSGK